MSFSIGFDTNRMKKEAVILDNLLKKKAVLVLYISNLDSARKLLEVHKDYRKGNKHYFVNKGSADTMQGMRFDSIIAVERVSAELYLRGKSYVR
tara:strand:- start:434 stop:715 length:282 start_codon:yes stop_codon:yes gene_type:complete